MRWDENATFGPPSNPILISKFLQDAASLCNDLSPSLDNPIAEDMLKWDEVDEMTRKRIGQECRIDDMAKAIRFTLENPKKSVFVQDFHHSSLQLNEERSAIKGKGRSRRIESQDASPSTTLECSSIVNLEPDIARFKEAIETVPLKCWNTTTEASLYSRVRHNEDINSLSEIKHNPVPDDRSSLVMSSLNGVVSKDNPAALITYTFYTRSLFLPHNFRRSSTHVALSTQTLGDVYDNMPCVHKFLPKEILSQDGKALVGYEDCVEEGQGAVICEEGIAHGDGLGHPDYAEKLKTYVNKKGPGFVHLGDGMHDVVLADLEIRLHQPYHILHQGDCEHFIIFNQIRLPTPTDPPSNYPLTIQLSPINVTSKKLLCKICNRLAAELSIVGDVRIGEPVALVCRMCWQMLGPPVEGRDESVMVVRLLGDEGLG